MKSPDSNYHLRTSAPSAVRKYTGSNGILTADFAGNRRLEDREKKVRMFGKAKAEAREPMLFNVDDGRPA
jgi:hypothetical protein